MRSVQHCHGVAQLVMQSPLFLQRVPMQMIDYRLQVCCVGARESETVCNPLKRKDARVLLFPTDAQPAHSAPVAAAAAIAPLAATPITAAPTLSEAAVNCADVSSLALRRAFSSSVSCKSTRTRQHHKHGRKRSIWNGGCALPFSCGGLTSSPSFFKAMQISTDCLLNMLTDTRPSLWPSLSSFRRWRNAGACLAANMRMISGVRASDLMAACALEQGRKQPQRASFNFGASLGQEKLAQQTSTCFHAPRLPVS